MTRTDGMPSRAAMALAMSNSKPAVTVAGVKPMYHGGVRASVPTVRTPGTMVRMSWLGSACGFGSVVDVEIDGSDGSGAGGAVTVVAAVMGGAGEAPLVHAPRRTSTTDIAGNRRM